MANTGWADPGGFPLYKGVTTVGGVGVIADRVYGLDQDISDLDHNLDELDAYLSGSLRDLSGTKDHKESVAAFLEKREPRYIGQ